MINSSSAWNVFWKIRFDKWRDLHHCPRWHASRYRPVNIRLHTGVALQMIRKQKAEGRRQKADGNRREVGALNDSILYQYLPFGSEHTQFLTFERHRRSKNIKDWHIFCCFGFSMRLIGWSSFQCISSSAVFFSFHSASAEIENLLVQSFVLLFEKYTSLSICSTSK